MCPQLSGVSGAADRGRQVGILEMVAKKSYYESAPEVLRELVVRDLRMIV